jgi:hypothetical protein
LVVIRLALRCSAKPGAASARLVGFISMSGRLTPFREGGRIFIVLSLKYNDA